MTLTSYYEFMADICSPTWNSNTSVGNPQELSIEQLWNSPKAQEIRRSVLNETFDFCNTDICWRILEGKLERRDEVKDPVMRNIIKNNITVIPGGPEFINIAYNPVCNLYCRMCRDERIVQMDEKHKNKTISDLKNYKFFNLKRLIIPGSGELFANKDYIELLQNINEEQFPKLEAIWINSNGVLFNERNWNKISHLSSRYKIKVFISTDSVCKETFTKIRRGGNYASFKDNLKTVRELRHRGEISKLYFAFCVQRINFREMSEFVSFAHENGADSVHFEKLFHAPISECVHRPENVYYDDFVCELKKAIGKGRKLGIDVEAKPFMDVVRRNHLA